MWRIGCWLHLNCMRTNKRKSLLWYIDAYSRSSLFLCQRFLAAVASLGFSFVHTNCRYEISLIHENRHQTQASSSHKRCMITCSMKKRIMRSALTPFTSFNMLSNVCQMQLVGCANGQLCCAKCPTEIWQARVRESEERENLCTRIVFHATTRENAIAWKKEKCRRIEHTHIVAYVTQRKLTRTTICVQSPAANRKSKGKRQKLCARCAGAPSVVGLCCVSCFDAMEM